MHAYLHISGSVHPDLAKNLHAAPEGKYHGEEPKEIEPRSPQAKGRKAQEAKRVEPVNEGQSSELGDKKLRL
jgi:hypothetical protein